MNNYEVVNGLGKLKAEVKEKRFEVKSYVTGNDIESIIIDGIEGGTNYWALIDNGTEEFEKFKDIRIPLSQKIVEIIFNGGEVIITDMEEGEEAKHTLSLESILKGISMNMERRPHDCDLQNMDATTVDCIIQYAIFDDVIFG